ncbi:MAG: DMT family transporter [Bacteroidales bacterium]|nr:DMT family transporter [Bacteroidales bacterium]
MRLPTTLRSDSLLLLTSLIWGLAFVAQRVGMDYVGPFIFNGIRFFLGALVILPFILLAKNSAQHAPRTADRASRTRHQASNKLLIVGGLILGLSVFAGATFQQVGLVYTTAGNAGFITGLYVVFVPILGLLRRQFPHYTVWIAALLAVVGLYFLSVTESFSLRLGDFLVLIGAVFWAVHVLIISVLSPRVNALKLALVQYIVCAVLSTCVALAVEHNTLEGILQATIPILYGGVLSVGIAYTLQVIAQKKAPPAHAAIILSLEAVFAAIGGWLILGEQLGTRGLIGCGLMLLGMLVAQYATIRKQLSLRTQ